MRRSNRKGFTIVELVIVIAVIAILAAVLIPTFSSVVENAKESAALQEARNSYTEYLAAHPEADINYIKSEEGKIYDVKNDFKIVESATGEVLEIGTCLDGNDSDDDGKCDKCGWTLTE